MQASKVLILSLVSFCLINVCFSQNFYFTKNYTVADGLLTNNIGYIKKDSNGFLWFQSLEGLVRFDGRRLLRYNESDIPVVSLDSGIKKHQLFFINNAKSEGIIFLDSQNKLTKTKNIEGIRSSPFYNKKICRKNSETYIRLKNSKTAYDYLINQYYSFENSNESINEDCNYLIGKNGEVHYIEDGILKNKYKKPTAAYTYFIIKDYLILLNLKTFETYTFKQGKEISKCTLLPKSIFAKNKSIFWEQRLSNSTLLLIGTKIYQAFLKDNQINLELFFQIPENQVGSAFFYDETNNKILIYSLNKGVTIFNTTRFKTYKTNNSIIDNILYTQEVFNKKIITNQDVYRNIISKETPSWSWSYTAPIYALNKKLILTSTPKHLIIIDKDFKILKRFDYNLPNKESNIATSFVSTDSAIYISGSALFKYNIKKNTIIRLPISIGSTLEKGFEYTAASPHANCIYTCIGGSLIEVNLSNYKYTKIAQGFNSEVRHIYYDSSTKIIFVSTRYDGCFCVLTNGTVIKLPNGINQSFKTCHYVLQDKQGDYWLPTNNGLYCLFKKDLLRYINKQVNNVTYKFWGKDDGIVNEEFNGGFTSSGIIIGDSLSLCSMEGRVVFHPNIKYETEKESGRLIIDAIQLDDTSLSSSTSFVQLQPNFKQLNIKVAYPFVNNNKGVIEYRLIGTNDTSWQVVNENGLIDIKNLQAGKYSLSIKVGTNRDNFKTIAIEVLPYWYNTWWMYGVYALLLAIALYILISLRILQIKNKQLALLEKSKSLLFTTIAHDLKSPINNFTTLSDTMQFLIAEKDFDTIAAIGADMDKKSKNITLLLGNLLDWSLNEQAIQGNTINTINLQLLLATILPPYKDIAANKQVTIINQIAHQVNITTNEQALSTIIRNLVDNAIKNAIPNSLLNIYAQQNDRSIYLQISNTTNELAIQKIALIQKKIRLSEPLLPLADGVGLGLALIQSNVIKIGGTIKIGITQQDVTFYLELPNLK